MLSVLIADDHEVVRRGLKDLLHSEFAELEIGEASNGDELAALLIQRRWSLILLDVIMPGRNVIDMLADIRRADPQVPILILTVMAEPQYAVRALKAGANGYITKQHAGDELIAAVHKVLAGGTYLTDETVLALATGKAATVAPHDSLSERELAVLRLIAHGRPVKAIAHELSLSAKTVATYITRIRDKTGLYTYVEMTRYALQHRLVD